MNTSTVYVEPIFVGCLIGLALALPFYDNLMCFYHYLPSDQQIGATFLGVFVIGVAYLIGIPADRLLDSLMEGLEKHHRIRFAITAETPKQETAKGGATEKDESSWAKILAGKDPFPENQYRTNAFLYAGPAFNDWLQYIRTRVRMTRALAFAIPNLTFAGLAYRALNDNPSLTQSYTAWLLKGGVLIAWIFAMLFVLLLQGYTSKLDSWRPRGRWHPPRTDDSRDIINYVQDRPAKNSTSAPIASPPTKTSIAGLFLDVALQPFPVSSALLLLAAAVVGYCSSGRAGLIPAALGALLTCTVGYAWWRSTETFMTYLLIAGRELERSASRAGRAT